MHVRHLVTPLLTEVRTLQWGGRVLGLQYELATFGAGECALKSDLGVRTDAERGRGSARCR
jgi:hypothetical protein